MLPALLAAHFMKESGCEAQQSPLFYSFVSVFCLDRTHTTKGLNFA